MTLILKFALDMVKIYHHTKNEVSMSNTSKVIAGTDRQTDRQTDRHHGNIIYPRTGGNNNTKPKDTEV